MMKKTLWFFMIFALLLSACGPTAAPAITDAPLPTATATIEPIPYASPDWFDHAVVYEIFVRSFADSDGDGIGDLNGITEMLDYIKGLGVDVIWLMPIHPSPTVHGYHVTDFFAVNPEYGTLEDLQVLVAAAHDRDMYLILDFVSSHISKDSPLFQQAYGNPEADNSDWFAFTNKTHTQYASFANNDEIPRFNHYNPEVVDYLIEAALFWMDLDGDGDYSDGVDGFRIDNITFPPSDFFFSLRQAVKSANPDALLLGEAWVTDARTLSAYYQDQFDALFDFPLYGVVQGNHNGVNDGLLASHPVLIKNLLAEQNEHYPAEAQVVRFFSNHDTNRIAAKVNGDLTREKQAISLLAALPGPILVYYGEEIGMLGQKGTAPHWDSYRRAPLDWFADESGPNQTTWFMEPDRWNAPHDGISVEEQSTNPASLLTHYRHVLATRRISPAVLSGTLEFLEVSADGQGALAFVRAKDAQTIVAVFNFGDEALEITITGFPFMDARIVDMLSWDVYHDAASDGIYTLTLPPGAAVWLTVQ